jgi:muramoyltetrapeptide carboxypeptidase
MAAISPITPVSPRGSPGAWPGVARGDLIAVVAPSSPIPEGELWRGLAWLRLRYRLRVSPAILSRDAYLAGDDGLRAAELASAMCDDEVKAIVAARGGYGVMRILQDLPWEAFADRPKPIVGFSDVTALHAMAWRAGVRTVHGPNVSSFGRGASPAVRLAWINALEAPASPRAWRGLRVVHPGPEATGPLIGGNLALLHAMAAAGMLDVPSGAVLAIEDVSEAPYRVDRMLTSLLLGGHLARASAILAGSFEACGPRPDGRTVDDVLADRTRVLGVPVLAGAPFGHGAHNEAFVLGAPATVRGDQVLLHPA